MRKWGKHEFRIATYDINAKLKDWHLFYLSFFLSILLSRKKTQLKINKSNIRLSQKQLNIIYILKLNTGLPEPWRVNSVYIYIYVYMFFCLSVSWSLRPWVKTTRSTSFQTGHTMIFSQERVCCDTLCFFQKLILTIFTELFSQISKLKQKYK